MNKGEFIKEKLHNMCLWVEEHIGKENLPIDVVHASEIVSPVLVMAMAMDVRQHSTLITHRDWRGLIDEMTKAGHSELVAIMLAVRAKEEMHDKFWRYLELFRDVTNSNSGA